MKINKKRKTLVCVILIVIGYANLCFAFSEKEENPFLEKAYWEGLPSKEDIDKKIEEGYSITKANKHGFDPTTYAIFGHNPIATIDYLLSKGNDVNKITHDFRTYIFWAAYKGNLDLMKHLVSKGAKTDLIDSHGYSLVNFSAATGQTDIELYEFCIAQGADLKKEKSHDGKNVLLSIAPKLKDLTMVDYFLAKGLDINYVDRYGNGIFNHAAKGGNIKILKALVERGVDFKKNKETEENAIFFATKGGRGITINKDVFVYLESLGLESNITNNKGETPLHNLANSSKDISDFEYFLNKGVDINALDEKRNNALIKASRRNTLEVVTYLAEKSYDVNLVNDEGNSALTKAVNNNTVGVVAYLLSKNAKTTIIDNKNNTLARVLIDNYNCNKPEVFDEKTKALTSKGLDLKELQGDGSTLYHLAISKNNLALLKKVDKLQVADIDAKDNKGNTILHYAAMKNDNPEILFFLINKGANKKIKTAFGESVYDLAKENELLDNSLVGFLK